MFYCGDSINMHNSVKQSGGKINCNKSLRWETDQKRLRTAELNRIQITLQAINLIIK